MVCLGLEPGWQNQRRRWIHWAMAAPLLSLSLYLTHLNRPGIMGILWFNLLLDTWSSTIVLSIEKGCTSFILSLSHTPSHTPTPLHTHTHTQNISFSLLLLKQSRRNVFKTVAIFPLLVQQHSCHFFFSTEGLLLAKLKAWPFWEQKHWPSLLL